MPQNIKHENEAQLKKSLLISKLEAYSTIYYCSSCYRHVGENISIFNDFFNISLI